MDLQLDSKRVLVVGGSGFIGRAVADRFLREGASVMLAGRTADTLQETAQELRAGREVTVEHVVLDTTDTASVSEAVSAMVDLWGGVDVLVSSGAPAAGAIIAGGAERDELESIREAFEVKGMGCLRVARAVVPHMTAAGGGRIVNICGQHVHLSESIAALVRNVTVAAVSKGLADELAGTGITVNVVHPGPVAADLSNATAPVATGDLGTTTPDAIADLVAFLGSPLAETISGSSIDIGHRVQGLSGF